VVNATKYSTNNRVLHTSKKKEKKTGYCRIFFQVSFKSTKTSKTNVLHFPNIYIYLKNKKTSAAKFIARP